MWADINRYLTLWMVSSLNSMLLIIYDNRDSDGSVYWLWVTVRHFGTRREKALCVWLRIESTKHNTIVVLLCSSFQVYLETLLELSRLCYLNATEKQIQIRNISNKIEDTRYKRMKEGMWRMAGMLPPKFALLVPLVALIWMMSMLSSQTFYCRHNW